MSALSLAVLVQQQAGIEPVLQYACRDRYLLGMQSDLLGAHAIGLRNLLIFTGDPRKSGDYSDATVVFDVDSIGLTNAVSRLNRGVRRGRAGHRRADGLPRRRHRKPRCARSGRGSPAIRVQGRGRRRVRGDAPRDDLDAFDQFRRRTAHVPVPIIAARAAFRQSAPRRVPRERGAEHSRARTAARAHAATPTVPMRPSRKALPSRGRSPGAANPSAGAADWRPDDIRARGARGVLIPDRGRTSDGCPTAHEWAAVRLVPASCEGYSPCADHLTGVRVGGRRYATCDWTAGQHDLINAMGALHGLVRALSNRSGTDEFVGGSDAASRTLSVTAVENRLRRRGLWQVGFGLRPRVRADAARGPVAGHAADGDCPGDRILEVGVGTGINLALYPRDCAVTGIDLSDSMLEKAHERVAEKAMRNVSLLEMDAARLTFPDDSFDIVYAPYLISVVPDPVQVAREMRRVCRRAGASSSSITSGARAGSCRGPSGCSLRSPCTSGSSRDLDLPGVSRAGRVAAGVNREGEHPAHLVARHLHHRLTASASNSDVARLKE